MKKLILVIATLSFLFPLSNIFAREFQTVTLAVDGMTCKMCPITVKKALKKLDGVTEVEAKYEGDGNGWARVTYDSAKVSVDDLTFTTEEAGYPSKAKN